MIPYLFNALIHAYFVFNKMSSPTAKGSRPWHAKSRMSIFPPFVGAVGYPPYLQYPAWSSIGWLRDTVDQSLAVENYFSHRQCQTNEAGLEERWELGRKTPHSDAGNRRTAKK